MKPREMAVLLSMALATGTFVYANQLGGGGKDHVR